MDVRQVEIDAERVVAEELAAAKKRIIENHFAAGQKASGRTAESLFETVVNENGRITGTLDGRAYFAALETGSGPWREPHKRKRKDGTEYSVAPKWFVDIIRQWAADKGITLISPWGVATNQMLLGTKLYREGGRDDIFSNEIPELVKHIADRLAGLYDAQIVESILRQQHNE